MTTSPDPLVLARAVGDQLCADALWHERRATWLGDATTNVAGAWEVVHESVEGDVYGGTAGIGIFLTRLWRLTGDDRHRDTARGAFAHAVAWHRHAKVSGSLYSGSAGVAAALAEGAETFDAQELRDEAVDLTFDALEALPESNDLIAGRAGGILALLELGRVLGLSEATDAACTLGEALVRGAEEIPGQGVAWASDIGGDEPPLCGLAHGASGPALALGELAATYGDRGFAETAARAEQYERAWYRRDEANWPDLRELTRVSLRRGEAPASPVYWCHGALGIGLARLRHYERTRDTAALVDAGAALQCAERQLVRLAASESLSADVSQCHGLAAFAELFLEGARILEQPALLRPATECGELASASRNGAGEWPCGVHDGGENPSLMLGLAGIGMMFLRIADPAVRPIGLLYTDTVTSHRLIVQLRGETTAESLQRRTAALCAMVPGAAVERYSKRGRLVLRLPADASTASVIERFSELSDVEYAEADAIDHATNG